MTLFTEQKIKAPNFEAIPHGLKEHPKWMVWRTEPTEKEPNKLGKVPYQVNGYRGSKANPKHYLTFEQAKTAYETGKFDGVGVVINRSDRLVCVDLDDFEDMEDIPAEKHNLTLHSYTELSPSEHGLHIWVRGQKPEWAGTKKNGVELFGSMADSFVTVTGNVFNPKSVMENQKLIDRIADKYFSEDKPKEKRKSELSYEPTTDLSDEEVLKIAVQKNIIVRKLFYEGDFSDYKSGTKIDQSKADFALCYDFAKITNNAEQIERLFKKSALYRKPPLKHKTYPQRTIAKALYKVAAEKERDNTQENPQKIREKDSTKYFGGDRGKTFIPKRLGDEIMKENPLFYDGSYIYVYKNGVYHRDLGGIIGFIVVDKLDEDFKRDRLMETVTYLKNKKWVSTKKINRNTDLINVQNGLLEWKTGTLHPHTPKYISTTQLPVMYDPQEECPNIDKFLSEVVPCDTVQTIHEWFGYSMIPSTKYEKAVICTGSGANGKSKLIELFEQFIGKNNISNVALQDLENNRFKLAQLYGKLANVFADIPSQGLEKTSVFKTVVSGDSVSAEFKGRDSFDFNPYASLMFSANELPRSMDLTDGFFRKILIINFPNKFGEGGLPKDPQIMDKLSTDTELSGLLNKAMAGLRHLDKMGEFTINKSTIEALEQYKRDIDPLITFVEEECELGKDSYENKQNLYDAYTWWCSRSGVKALGKIKFYGRMEKSFKLKEVRPTSKSERKFLGIVLKEREV